MLLQLSPKHSPHNVLAAASLPVQTAWDMMSGMTNPDETDEPPGNSLCKSCGLCCTGHLFTWTKLRSAEMDSAQALGLNVFRSHPRQRGFSQPCPLWDGQCTVYDSPHYPRFCRTYKCRLLKQLLDENISLPRALTAIADVKRLIREAETLLPPSTNQNFRERLAAEIESPENTDRQFRRKADELLALYQDIFGITDVVELSSFPAQAPSNERE